MIRLGAVYPNAALIANATLRHKFGLNPSYERDSDAKRRVKSFAGRALRKAGFAPDVSTTDMVTFRIDENVESFIVDVEPFPRNF